MGQKMGELIWNMQQQTIQAMHGLLPKIDERIDKKTGEVIKPIQERERAVTIRNAWNSAIDQAAAEPGMEGVKAACDFPKDENGKPKLDANGQPLPPPLMQFIFSQPLLNQWRYALNKNPEAAAKQGVTHATLLKQAYQLWSTPERIKAAEKAARQAAINAAKGAGEQPGTHTQTIPSDGMDWDEIEKSEGYVDPFTGKKYG